MKIDINPKKELFRWGPIDGKLIYPDFFNVAFIKFNKIFYHWPSYLWVGDKNRMTCICELHKLYKGGEKNFRTNILGQRNFDKYNRLWNNNLKTLLLLQKNISAPSLQKMSNSVLAGTYENWALAYIDFWAIGLLPEIANWGGEMILKERLEKLVPPSNFVYIFERLSAPVNLSFYQRAELDLLKLKKFSKKPKLLNQKLVLHQKKYFWILNSYHHTQVLEKDYFKKELAGYSFKKAQAEIKELESHSKRVKKEKGQIIKKYQLKPEIRKIADRLAFSIWWQDLRKYYIFLANHQIDLFLTEFSRRFEINFENIHYYNVYEIVKLVKTEQKVKTAEIKRRQLNLVVYYSERFNKLEYISGPRAKKVSNRYTAIKVDKKIKEFKGLVVSRGKLIKAKVRILTSVAHFNQMKKGEVLVAAMTSPDYIVVIKKASAIITDEGGMTSHAAIVSRELKIPCIVGTRIATKALKDGDLVEVNTTSGVIKKL